MIISRNEASLHGLLGLATEKILELAEARVSA
jgi:hypothetical protein